MHPGNKFLSQVAGHKSEWLCKDKIWYSFSFQLS